MVKLQWRINNNNKGGGILCISVESIDNMRDLKKIKYIDFRFLL